MKKGIWTKSIIAVSLSFGAISGANAAGLDAADIVFIVDKSGSMGGEHAWITSMVTSLESELLAAGIGAGADTNRYAMVGFGGSGAEEPGHVIPVGGGTFGTASELSTAAGGLTTTGATEDGWDGINTALGLAFRADAAKNFILITDEDRDNLNNALTFGGLLTSMLNDNILLNAVLNHNYTDGGGAAAIGIDSASNAYVADGGGSYTQNPGGTATTGAGTTKADYVDLALATGGAAWDLNILRAGGLLADSFTSAFVDIKVQEIVTQTEIPVPAIPALMALGLLGLMGSRQYRRV